MSGNSSHAPQTRQPAKRSKMPQDDLKGMQVAPALEKSICRWGLGHLQVGLVALQTPVFPLPHLETGIRR